MCIYCQPVVWHSQNYLYKIYELREQLSEYEIKMIHLDNIDKYSRWWWNHSLWKINVTVQIVVIGTHTNYSVGKTVTTIQLSKKSKTKTFKLQKQV